jgi:glycosyltransferase involved in cell wall biosynthesis
MRSSAGRSGKRRPVVTYVIAGYPPRIGGAEIQAHRVARLLVPDFEVRVLTGQVNGYPARETIDGVQVRRIPLRDRSAPGEQPTDEGGLTTALLDALVAAGYGLVGPRPSVIQGFQMNGLTFGAAALAEVRRVPLITTLTGNVVVERLTAGGKLGRGKLALLGRASHAVVAVSRSVYRTAARAGIPEAKLRTVPNGVDTSYFCPPDGEARCHARAELGYEPDDFVFC